MQENMNPHTLFCTVYLPEYLAVPLEHMNMLTLATLGAQRTFIYLYVFICSIKL